MEAEFLDSLTNERPAAVIDMKTDEKYKVVKGMGKSGLAKDAFKFRAEKLRDRLDEFHGRKLQFCGFLRMGDRRSEDSQMMEGRQIGP
ncbi:MAG: hypothetical protein GTN74_01750 [Proteobacteria bacterium]|nr:hypothetical protein [Pseudomonadota bacterium]NIS67839.1 hypothetical protein [Pseudomonadota bacterium]